MRSRGMGCISIREKRHVMLNTVLVKGVRPVQSSENEDYSANAYHLIEYCISYLATHRHILSPYRCRWKNETNTSRATASQLPQAPWREELTSTYRPFANRYTNRPVHTTVCLYSRTRFLPRSLTNCTFNNKHKLIQNLLILPAADPVAGRELIPSHPRFPSSRQKWPHHLPYLILASGILT